MHVAIGRLYMLTSDLIVLLLCGSITSWCFSVAAALSGGLNELQIAFVCREILKVRERKKERVEKRRERQEEREEERGKRRERKKEREEREEEREGSERGERGKERDFHVTSLCVCHLPRVCNTCTTGARSTETSR